MDVGHVCMRVPVCSHIRPPEPLHPCLSKTARSPHHLGLQADTMGFSPADAFADLYLPFLTGKNLVYIFLPLLVCLLGPLACSQPDLAGQLNAVLPAAPEPPDGGPRPPSQAWVPWAPCPQGRREGPRRWPPRLPPCSLPLCFLSERVGVCSFALPTMPGTWGALCVC